MLLGGAGIVGPASDDQPADDEATTLDRLDGERAVVELAELSATDDEPFDISSGGLHLGSNIEKRELNAQVDRDAAGAFDKHDVVVYRRTEDEARSRCSPRAGRIVPAPPGRRLPAIDRARTELGLDATLLMA